MQLAAGDTSGDDWETDEVSVWHVYHLFIIFIYYLRHSVFV